MTKTDLVISGRLKQLLPMKPEEFNKLEANIVADGRVIDPILYWNDGTKNLVIDGMHRFEVASKHKIPYRSEPMEFESIEQAEVWILDHFDGRRHLIDKAALRKQRGELYNKLKGKPGGANGQTGGALAHREPTVSTSGGGNAAEHVVAKHGGSVATVKRDAKYVDSYN